MEQHYEQLSLVERLRERIRREGALSFRDWMEAALYDERGGYYRRSDLARWGRAGDYRTAPESAPLFAATFARYFADLYARLGAPRRWTICEAGAGAGHFARGVLETLESDFPEAFAAVRYLVDESSPASRALVGERLARFSDRVEFVSQEEVAPRSLTGVVFSNELLDAMPVHRVCLRGGRLRELRVGLDGAGDFIWVEHAPSTPRLAEHFARARVVLAEGQCAEVNLAAEEWIARGAAALSRGFLVTIDYGAEAAQLYDPTTRPSGTLRAFRAHHLSDDPLARPGEQDLTSTIDWTQVRYAGETAGLRTVCFEPLDRFLLRAGALELLERMAARSPDEAGRMKLRLAARELILPGGLGESFSVLVQQRL